MCKEAAHDAMPATKKYSVGIHSSALHCEPRFVQLVAYQNTHVGDEQSHRTSSLIVHNRLKLSANPPSQLISTTYTIRHCRHLLSSTIQGPCILVT